MKRYTFSDLGAQGVEHVASSLVPGEYIARGGLSFHAVGWRTHDGEEAHVHEDAEIFCIMQGRGEIEIDGTREPVHAGEVLVIEPGEDHHLIGDPQHPIINLWFHCGDEPHPNQQEA
jgi:mannose-6-phosphate isomerase-like protein (cupin superfamily)